MIDRTALNWELSTLTRVDKATLDRIGGSLRKENMVSIGGRGPNAPRVTPEDVKNILLGLLGSDNASRAAEAVKELTLLQSSETGRTVGEAIVDLLTNEKARENLAAICVTRNYPRVEICWGYENEAYDGFFDEFPNARPRSEVFQGQGQDAVPHFAVVATLDGAVVNTIVHSAQWLKSEGY